MYVSLEDVDISKAKEEHLKKIMKENREIEEDIAALRIIGEIRFQNLVSCVSSTL